MDPNQTVPVDPILAGFPTHSGFKVVPPCILIEKLGEGAMGVVWRARHYNLEVDVAVKFLRPDASAMSQEFVDRFQREARIAASIKQENLVGVFDTLEGKGGVCYTVMELVDGETVEGRVARKGPLSYPEAATILMLSMKGLAALHERRIIHRDVKPSNIIVSRDGHVKLADLGIARDDERFDTLRTQANAIIGTPQYMSPEQFDSAAGVSDRSDVYAMGVTLLFMLTGRHVIAGDSLPEIMRRVCMDGVPPLTKFRPDAPPELVQLIAEMTSMKAAKRPEARAVINRLNRLLHVWVQEPLDLADPNASPTFSADQLPSRLDRTMVKEIRRAVTTNAHAPRPEQLTQAASAAYALTQAQPPQAQPPQAQPSYVQPPYDTQYAAPGGQPAFGGHAPPGGLANPGGYAPQWGPGTAPAAYAPPPATYPYPQQRSGHPLLKTAAVLLAVGVVGAGSAVYFVPELRAKAMSLIDGGGGPTPSPTPDPTPAPTRPVPTPVPTQPVPTQPVTPPTQPATPPTQPVTPPPPPVNARPTITVRPADVRPLPAGTATSVPFMLADAESDAGSLTATAESSDPGAVAVAQPTRAGAGWAVRLTPTASATAASTATITIKARDPDGGEGKTEFDVTVAAAPNTPPTVVAAMPAAAIPFGQPSASIGLTLDDKAGDVALVTARATSGDPAIVPANGVSVQGTGRDRQLVVFPTPGQAGHATITVTVTDPHGQTARATVAVTVAGELAEARRAAAGARPDWPRVFQALAATAKEAATSRSEPQFAKEANRLLTAFREAFPERPAQRKSWDDRRAAVPGLRAHLDALANDGQSSVAALLGIEDRVRYRRYPDPELLWAVATDAGYEAHVNDYAEALKLAKLATELPDPQYEACAYAVDICYRHTKLRDSNAGRAWQNLGDLKDDIPTVARRGFLWMAIAARAPDAAEQSKSYEEAKVYLERAAKGNARQRDLPICGLAAYSLATIYDRDPAAKAKAQYWHREATRMGYAREVEAAPAK